MSNAVERPEIVYDISSLNRMDETMKGHMRSIWRGIRIFPTNVLREWYAEYPQPYSNLFVRLRQTIIKTELKRRGVMTL